ncbi:MAG: tripartite tricarboxylate transporter substrate binding protein [Betaproteobacteria bacterium]|nr:tripartite tricarboxylate transporter substrate binding protein [Betaproteobacteria bacterium]
MKRMVLGVLIPVLSTAAAAQTGVFPAKPIRVVLPVPPGGSIDTVMRVIAPRMSETLGQSVVLESRPGASTNLGMELVARAPGDGYTLLANTLALVANISLFPKLGYHPERDFAAVSVVASSPSFIAVHPSVPVKTVKELIVLAKRQPDTIKFGTAGAGGIAHLAVELLASQTGTRYVHVPYKGGGPALVALMSGEVDMAALAVVAAAGFVHSNRLRVLAVTSAKRMPRFPNIPTVAESGAPQYEFNSWVGVVAPVATPAPIIKILNEHMVRAAKAPDVVERFAKDGAEVVASTPEQFKKVITEEVAMWARVIKQAGIRAD